MAITENGFTAEEFSGAIAANPDLLPIIKGTLTEKHKFVVHDEAEHATFLTGKETEITANLTKKHASKLEADVLELTGVPKLNADEKYYDYFKRATGEKLTAAKAMETELLALKAGAKPDEVQKARIIELEGILAKKDTDYTEGLSKKDGEIRTMKLKGNFDVAIAKVRAKYKQGMPESMVSLAENAIVSELMSIAKIQEDGVITFPKEDGTPELDPKTYKPIALEDKLADKLKDLLDPAKIKLGTGTDPNDKGKKPGDTTFTGLPAGCDTQLKLTTHLAEIGILQGTDEFDDIFEKFGKDLKLR